MGYVTSTECFFSVSINMVDIVKAVETYRPHGEFTKLWTQHLYHKCDALTFDDYGGANAMQGR